MSPSSRYYPHIDGLRAIAVLSVLFYHADLAPFSGGFVGVDIFFVISGYLITAHLTEELRANRFSVGYFYLRRVRRIVPALLFTLLFSFLVGALLLPPAILEQTGLAAILAALSVSNIFFWSQSGYFDSDAFLKPLLHTWSLGVEEQFYLFWPFIILLAHRRGIAVNVIIGLGLLSLLVTSLLLPHDPAAAFFLTPFRISEFAIGAILGYKALIDTQPRNWIAELTTLGGLGLIAYAVLTYSHDTPFPGLTALAPCIGAAALLYGGRARLAGRLLDNRVFVKIGLISYSLYLAHWPVIAFYRYARGLPLSFLDQCLVISLSFVLAALMYRFIERPFRFPPSHPRHLPARALGGLLGGGTLFVILIAGSAALYDGWAWRSSNPGALTAQEIERGQEHRFQILNEICGQRGRDHCEDIAADRPNILILGDSHAPDGLNILFSAFPEEYFVIRTLAGCPPMMPADQTLLAPNHPDRLKCIEENAAWLDPHYLSQFEYVAISVYFEWYKPEHLAPVIDRIRAAGVDKILVFGNFVSLLEDMPNLLARGLDPRSDERYVKSFDLYRQELERLAAEKGFKLIPKTRYLCNAETFSSCDLRIADRLVLYDQHHLSYEAAERIGHQLRREYGSFTELFSTP